MRRIAILFSVVLLVVVGLVWNSFRSFCVDQAERLSSESRLVETRSGPIEYQLAGDSGPILLGIHGTPGGYDQLAGIIPRALDAGYRLLLVSRPGYLRTPIEVGRTSREQADSYVALLDVLEIDRVGVIAISGGGPSGLELAARHSKRVSALVHLMGVSGASEIEIAPSLSERFFMTDFGGFLASRMLDESAAFFIEEAIPDPVNRERILTDPEKQDSVSIVLRSMFVFPSQRMAGLMNDIDQFGQLDLTPFEEIKAPTLVIHGTADTSVPLEMGLAVADRVQTAERIIIEGGDHFIPMSHPDEVFDPIFEFFARHIVN